jgi:hypothetical protein
VPAATLTYQYATRTAWLDDPAASADPAAYDLCANHAEGLRVPVGWKLDDRRGRGGLFRVAPIAV